MAGKKKTVKAKPSDLGKGAARKAADAIVSNRKKTQNALSELGYGKKPAKKKKK
jgi:hypothetical protein